MQLLAGQGRDLVFNPLLKHVDTHLPSFFFRTYFAETAERVNDTLEG